MTIENAPKILEVEFELALAQFDTIQGVVYKNNHHDPEDDNSPYAYEACVTMADCYCADALPLDEDLNRLDGYEIGIPIDTKSFGEPLTYRC